MYILNDQGEPEECKDIERWSRWFENDERRIVRKQAWGDISVSTVFLGIDHGGWRRGASPVLWETMVFDGEGNDQGMWRWSSREEAIGGHNSIVRQLGGVVLE